MTSRRKVGATLRPSYPWPCLGLRLSCCLVLPCVRGAVATPGASSETLEISMSNASRWEGSPRPGKVRSDESLAVDMDISSFALSMMIK